MFDRKPRRPEGPVLLDRVIDSGARRVAVLGLHPRAGARLALSALVTETQRRGLPVAVVSVPRVPPDSDIITADPVTRAELPAGAFLATAERAASSSEAELTLVASTDIQTPLGGLSLYRVAREGAVDLYGPVDPDPLADVLGRLAELSGATVFVEGSWERRSFAAPGVTDGIVLAVGAAYSATPGRSAAAVRYQVDTLASPPCSSQARAAWAQAKAGRAPVLVDGKGTVQGVLPEGLPDPTRALRTPDGSPVDTVLLPQGLHDGFLHSVVRLPFRCRLVVRDATRISVAPVYFKAWVKRKGSVEVVYPVRLLALATNPTNPAGPDADPVEFRRAVAEAVPELPVHDVVLDEEGEPRRPVWKFWQ